MKQTILLFVAIMFVNTAFCQQEVQNNEAYKGNHHFYMSVGYSQRLTNEPNELFINQTTNDDHFQSMKRGWNIGFAYDYYFHKSFAFGLKASAFTKESFINPSDTTEKKDDSYIFYIGPSFKWEFFNYEKYSIYLRGTLGYLSFRNTQQDAVLFNGSMTHPRKTFSNSALGYGLDFGIDYMLNDFISLGFNLGYMGAELGKLNVGDEEFTLNIKEKLHRLDFSLAVIIR